MNSQLQDLLHRLTDWVKSVFTMNQFVLDNHFIVEWGGTRPDFTEVLGLSFQREVVLLRDGAQPDSPARKLPGDEQANNLILRRYLKKGDLEMYNWWKEQSAQVSLRDVSVKLLNRRHEPEFVWLLRNAFPVRITYSPLTAQKAQPMIEEVELCFETMRLEGL